jgi:hypothetical protein
METVWLNYDLTVLLNTESTAAVAGALVPTFSPLSHSHALIAALSGGKWYELTVRVKMVASPVASGVSFVDFSA